MNGQERLRKWGCGGASPYRREQHYLKGLQSEQEEINQGARGAASAETEPSPFERNA